MENTTSTFRYYRRCTCLQIQGAELFKQTERKAMTTEVDCAREGCSPAPGES
jgi:hypothetical protein